MTASERLVRSNLPARLRMARRLLTLAWQDALEYRPEGLIWFLYDILPPLTMVLVWLAAYRTTDEVAGYTVSGMVSYYMGVITLRTLLNPHPEWEIAESIASGTLSQLLLKPMPFTLYQLTGEIAWKVMRLFWLLPSLAIAGLLLRDYLVWPELSAGQWLAFLVSLPLAYLTAFFIKVCMGLTAFWTIHSDGLFELMFMLEYLFSGNMLPLQALPPALQTVADWLPYKYYFFFSMQLFLGKVDGTAALLGLAMQVFWIAAGYVLLRVMWWLGLRRYSAFGG